MDEFRGYPVCVQTVTVGGRTYELRLPTRAEALLDDPRVLARFERDEYLPYWATLWRAALALAEVVAAWGPAPAAPPTVLELGCGLGLVSLLAAGLGYRVIASDYDEDALAFTRDNAARNGLPVPETRRIDWRERYADLRPDRIVAADVLYEARNLRPVAEFIRRHLAPGGIALIGDPNRCTADSFEQVLSAVGLAVRVKLVERPAAGRIFELRHTLR